MSRSAIYTRISRDAEGEAVGVTNQETAARELAAQHGLDVVAVFTDNDVSASTNSRKPRPGFDAMLAAADRGEFGTIIAYSMSRLTRRPSEWERLIDLGQHRGVTFLYKVSPRYDLNTADGRATARTVAAWDAAEAERTSERRLLRNAAQIAKGEPLGRPRVFGFEIDGMTPREDEAALLRDAYAALLSGTAVRQIAREWNAAGSRTTRGKEWSAVTLRNTLLRERNAGILVANGERQAQSKITPIVASDTWEAARAILQAPERLRNTGRPSGTRWLSGVALCGCGEQLVVGASWSKHKYSPAYTCALIGLANRTPGIKTPPGHARMKAELLEEAVVPELFKAMSSASSQVETKATPEMGRLVRERASVLEQLTRAKDLYSEFGGSDDLARARRLQIEADDLQSRIEAAVPADEPLSAAAREFARLTREWEESLVVDERPVVGKLLSAHDEMERWEAEFEQLDVDDKRALVRRYLSVTVRSAKEAGPRTVIEAL